MWATSPRVGEFWSCSRLDVSSILAPLGALSISSFGAKCLLGSPLQLPSQLWYAVAQLFVECRACVDYIAKTRHGLKHYSAIFVVFAVPVYQFQLFSWSGRSSIFEWLTEILYISKLLFISITFRNKNEFVLFIMLPSHFACNAVKADVHFVLHWFPAAVPDCVHTLVSNIRSKNAIIRSCTQYIMRTGQWIIEWYQLIRRQLSHTGQDWLVQTRINQKLHSS